MCVHEYMEERGNKCKMVFIYYLFSLFTKLCTEFSAENKNYSRYLGKIGT